MTDRGGTFESVVSQLEIECHVIGGCLAERLDTVVDLFGFPTVTEVDEAIALAQAEYAARDLGAVRAGAVARGIALERCHVGARRAHTWLRR